MLLEYLIIYICLNCSLKTLKYFPFFKWQICRYIFLDICQNIFVKNIDFNCCYVIILNLWFLLEAFNRDMFFVLIANSTNLTHFQNFSYNRAERKLFKIKLKVFICFSCFVEEIIYTKMPIITFSLCIYNFFNSSPILSTTINDAFKKAEIYWKVEHAKTYKWSAVQNMYVYIRGKNNIAKKQYKG